MDSVDTELDLLIRNQINPTLTVGERLELIQGSDSSELDKARDIRVLLGRIPGVESSDETIIEALIKRYSKEKRSGKSKPSWVLMMHEELAKVAEEYRDQHVITRDTAHIDSVMALHGQGSFREWSTKMASEMGVEYDIAMTDKVCAWKVKHGEDPSPTSRDKEERELGVWLNKTRAEKRAKERKGVL
jgi:hypothetical protein